MTNELEKTFFNTFGIEPKYNDGCKLADKYWANEELADEYITFDNYMDSCCTHGDSGACFSTCEYAYDDVQYPQITDRILLELICILTKRFDYADQNWLTKCDNAEALKVAVLRLLLLCTSEQIEIYKHQVLTLFEEG